jgi:hypothetical protein
MNKTTISSTFPVCGTRNPVIIEHFSHQYVPTLHQYTNYSYKFHVTWLKESKRDPVVNLRLQFLTIEKKKKRVHLQPRFTSEAIDPIFAYQGSCQQFVYRRGR